MRPAEVRVHRDLPPTPVWTYDGEMPGATFEVKSGEAVLVEWVNELPTSHFLPVDRTIHGAHDGAPEVRAVVHVHGAKAPPESDGYPEDWQRPGESTLAYYPNRQDAATLWYHDHAMGVERLNQYAGLFGAFFVRDDVERALNLPDEIPLLLCDRLFSQDGQLVYPTSGNARAPWVSEVNGDAHLVNGKIFPYLEVEPRRYRFRVVNAANSRTYDLAFGGLSFQQIGTDQGLLPQPVERTQLTLAPGERAEVVVDFAALAGASLLLKTGASELMLFRVARATATPTRPIPAKLRPIVPLLESEARASRTLTLGEYKEPGSGRMLMLLGGKRWQEPLTEEPRLGTVEIWSLVNLTEDTHPIHLHLVRFQVLDRQLFDADEYQTHKTMRLLGARLPPDSDEAGWKDTVRAHPGMVTRIIARFDGFPGRYVWHCHVLEHAANEMMRPFEVVAEG
jgi:spore coat protein A